MAELELLLSLDGLSQTVDRMTRLPNELATEEAILVRSRAEEALLALILGTNVLTGDTRGAWYLRYLSPTEIAVVNDRVTDRGFNVAAGLIGGTGQRGAAQGAPAGFDGNYSSVLGMDPSLRLRPTWDQLAAQPFAVPSILGGGL